MSEEVSPVVNDSSGRAPFLSNEAYDSIKFIAMILLPGIGTLYFALAQIWGFPNGPEVVGSITAFDVFLGLLLGLSSQQYNGSDAKYDGTMDIQQHDEGKTFSLSLNTHPEDLETKKAITFKVNPPEGS